MVETANTRLLIDTSPDLRVQALTAGFTQVDAILYTHAHADHLHGIDDIRSFNYHAQAPIPAYADAATLAELQARFSYAFLPPKPEFGWFRPCLIGHELIAGKTVKIGEIEVTPFRQHHGRVDSLGFRIGGFVYSTDVKQFPHESEPYLSNIDCWVLDCLTDESPMPTHAHLDLSLEWVERYKPKHAILTHMSHALEYDEVNKRTPAHVEAAYDGMQILL